MTGNPSMWCPNRLVHVIRQGDTLYQLAEQYYTTVQAIMAHNPYIDPYNLQIGSALLICPEEHPYPSQPTADTVSAAQVSLSNDMRKAWEQHVYWTRMLLISIAERLADQPDVTSRLLQNPNDIAAIFNRWYPDMAARLIAQLLTEHLQIGAALITALRDRNAAEAERLNQQWYVNADKMAMAFSSINPDYGREALRQMLYEHLKLTTEEAAMRLAANYPADIRAFDNVEREALAMADYFTQGIVTQFLQDFR